ncbi:hypothetical protein BGZ83_001816 [Gryganskiella cystojenkinii]|nr:hypothetical protein BGZ83_001816 [Gryganskiella cystojenkinii]
MSFEISPQWTFFPDVLALHCQECKSTSSSTSFSKVRKLEQDNHASDPTPAPKRRLLENEHIVSLSHPPANTSSTRQQDFKQDHWILARRWIEPLSNTNLSQHLPCGHRLQSDTLQNIAIEIKCQEGSVMAMVADRILCVRQDDHVDEAWVHDQPTQAHRGTLFSTIEEFKATATRVAIQAQLSLLDPDSDLDSSCLHITFDVFLHRSLLSNDLTSGRTFDTLMQSLLHFVFPPSLSSDHAFTENPIKDLYAHLNPAAEAKSPSNVQPRDLIPQLLPFQKRSVAWCLKRECGAMDEYGNVIYQEPSSEEKLPLTWERVTAASGQHLFINRLCGLLCIANTDFVTLEPEPRGGILAEEMGLGKTVEVLALILLNRRKIIYPQAPLDREDSAPLEEQMSAANLNDNDDDVKPEDGKKTRPLICSGATLIITPPSIVHQWASEIENHAPTLRVFLYVDGSHTSVEAKDLAQFDIVLTTYNMLAKELDYAIQHDRPRRYRQIYVPRKSAFVQIDWWRVCLDEAQLIEGSVSRAATMACMIPRVMSWAVSGTPVKRHLEDLHSLLQFLKQEPLGSNRQLWKLLNIRAYRATLISCYQRLMNRYSKRDVEQELSLPRQFRMAYGIHFSDIERANYEELWDRCLVLDVMQAQAVSQLYQKERSEVLSRIKRAVLQARIRPTIDSLPLFQQTEHDVIRHVTFWKNHYDQVLQKQKDKESAKLTDKGHQQQNDRTVMEETELEAQLDLALAGKAGASDTLALATVRHREWLEQHHRVLFYMAGTYHNLKMEAEEASRYEQAETVRLQLLKLPEQTFERRLAAVKQAVIKISLGDQFVIKSTSYTGGITMGRIMGDLGIISNALNVQLQMLDRWRQDLVERLTQPLMCDGEEGEQYQYSIDLQHTLESYLHFYVKLLMFRRDLISGSEESMVHHIKAVDSQRAHAAMVKSRESRVRSFKRKAGEEDEPKKTEDLDKRLETELFSLISPDLTSTLRTVRANIRSVLRDNSVPRAEILMAEFEDTRLKDIQNAQTKLILDLEREISHFRHLTGARTVYYRQLQAISDTVLDIVSMEPESDIANCLKEENTLQKDIVRLVAKQRYLDHIAVASNNKQSQSADDSLCLICRSPYEVGLMTECGHIFCEHCLLAWTKGKTFSKCPSCNSQISRKNMNRVGLRGASSADSTPVQEPNASSKKTNNLSTVPMVHLSEIRLVPESIRKVPIVDGYGSKIDSIVRHIVSLVQDDASTKCLVFSQWASLLALIAESLENNKIGLVKLQGNPKTAVKQFKENKDKHVFMLHAKSQSAGLTLLDATHIFICEPLVNPVLQAQAVSRVHRIGQQNETFVHYYLVLNTVEIPCFDLFERKQSAAAGAQHLRDGFHTLDDIAEETMDADTAITSSDVVKAQNRHGEVVKLEDLKFCFQTQKLMRSEGREL